MNEAYHQKNQKKRQKKQTDVKYLSICFLAKRKGKRFRYHLLRVLPCLYFLFFLFSSPPSILLIFLFPISFFFSHHVAINTKDLLILASLSPLLSSLSSTTLSRTLFCCSAYQKHPCVFYCIVGSYLILLRCYQIHTSMLQFLVSVVVYWTLCLLVLRK